MIRCAYVWMTKERSVEISGTMDPNGLRCIFKTLRTKKSTSFLLCSIFRQNDRYGSVNFTLLTKNNAIMECKIIWFWKLAARLFVIILFFDIQTNNCRQLWAQTTVKTLKRFKCCWQNVCLNPLLRTKCQIVWYNRWD